MNEWTLEKTRDGDWHEYWLCLDGEKRGYAKWRKVGEHAELHNIVVRSSKSFLIKARERLEDIRQDMRSEGVKLAVVLDLTSNMDALRLKYWNFMGFEYTGEVMGFTFAIMEV